MSKKADTSAPIPAPLSAEKPTSPRRAKGKITQEALAKHLCLDRGARSVRELFDRGILPDDVDRQNLTADDLDRCREAYILHLRTAAAGRVESKDDGPVDDSRDPDVQLALLRSEQVELARIKRRKILAELVERSDLRIAVSTAFSRVRAGILKVPKKHSGKLVSMTDEVELREYLDDKLREALEELASTPVEAIGTEVDPEDIEIEED